MTKVSLKEKKLIPDKCSLKKILGARWSKYIDTVKSLEKRKIYPEMYWYGPSTGWAPRFCIGEITICGICLIKNPLIGLIGIGDKVGIYLNNDKLLTQKAKTLYKMTPKKGPLRWIEVQLATNGDLEAFLSLVDAKLRALSSEGINPNKKSISFKKIKKNIF